jgi:hypothetical protein
MKAFTTLPAAILAVTVGAAMFACAHVYDAWRSRAPAGHVVSSQPPAPVAVAPFEMGQPDLVLLATGGCNGMLEVCNCSGPMLGGLSRRSGLAISYRAAFPNCMMIDTGDAFSLHPKDLRNQFILRGYREIGYDCLCLGDQEWAAGPAGLEAMLDQDAIPCLSSTIEPAQSQPPLPQVQDVIKRQCGQVKVAILCDVGPDELSGLDDDVAQTLQAMPLPQLSAKVDALKQEGYLVVLVSHTTEREMDERAGALNVDLILRGHVTAVYDTPRVDHVGGKPLVRIGSWQARGIGWDALAAVAIKVRDGKISQIESRVENVDERWPHDPRLLLVYQNYAHLAMQQAMTSERKDGLRYMSARGCGQCHVAQYCAWLKTRHGHAYSTLAAVRREGDPNCLACHTSGFGTRNGFVSSAATPPLANVNCQDCHRIDASQMPPSADSLQAIRDKTHKIDENTCAACHTAITDPKFSFKDRVKKIKCPH